MVQENCLSFQSTLYGILYFSKTYMILPAFSLVCSQFIISLTWHRLSLGGPVKGQQLSSRTQIMEGLPLHPQGCADTHSSRKLHKNKFRNLILCLGSPLCLKVAVKCWLLQVVQFCSRDFTSELLPWSWVMTVLSFFWIIFMTAYLGRIYGTYVLTSLFIFEECCSVVVRISLFSF